MNDRQALKVKWLSNSLRRVLYEFEHNIIGETHLSWLLAGMAPYDKRQVG